MINRVDVPSRPRRRGLAELSVVLLLAGVTVADYLAWLGWDQRRDVHPDGHETGPYQAWQVAGLVLVLAVVGVVAVWLDHAGAALLALPVALSAACGVDWAPDDGSGLWAVGVVMVFTATLVVTAVTVAIVALVRRLTLSR
ncbi:hypothetical protein [Actinomadura alba]|uniref:hypothetical protein n=1 Tax=Actinomadura alba TaxID=406431 RepID=UPI0031D96695